MFLTLGLSLLRVSQPSELEGCPWSPTVPLPPQPNRERGSVADFVQDTGHLCREGWAEAALSHPQTVRLASSRETGARLGFLEQGRLLACGWWGAGKCGPQGCPYLPRHTQPPPGPSAGTAHRSLWAGWPCSFPSQQSEAPKPPGAYSAGSPWHWARARMRPWEPSGGGDDDRECHFPRTRALLPHFNVRPQQLAG